MLSNNELNFILERHKDYISLCALFDLYKHEKKLNYPEIALLLNSHFQFELTQIHCLKPEEFKYNLDIYSYIPEEYKPLHGELQRKSILLLAQALYYTCNSSNIKHLKKLGELKDQYSASDYLGSYSDIFLKISEIKSILGNDELDAMLESRKSTDKSQSKIELNQAQILELEKQGQSTSQTSKMAEVNEDNYNPKERETHLKLIYALTMARTNKDFSARSYFNNKGILKPYTMMNDLINDFEESGIQGFSADSLRKKLAEILKMEELQTMMGKNH